MAMCPSLHFVDLGEEPYQLSQPEADELAMTLPRCITSSNLLAPHIDTAGSAGDLLNQQGPQ